MTDNKKAVNESRLNTIVKLAKRSMDMLVSDTNDELLIKPKSSQDLTAFNSDLDDVITVKLRKKIGL